MKLPNIILIHLIFSIIISCSHMTKIDQAKQSSQDIINKESFDRSTKSSIESYTLIADEKTLIYCKYGDSSKTLQKLKASYWKDNSKFYYWISISSCYFEQKDLSNAQFYLAFAKGNSDEQKAIIANNMALIHLAKNKLDLAQQLLQEATSKSTLLTPRLNLIKLYLKYYMPQNALDLINKLPNFSDDRALKYYQALAYYQSNKISELLRLKASTTDADIQLMQTKALITNNKLAQAQQLFEQIDKSYIQVQTTDYEEIKKWFKDQTSKKNEKK